MEKGCNNNQKNEKDNLYIIIPAYNEEANIKNVIEDWYGIVEKIGNGSKLVVIDDGSKDNTYKIMEECAKNKEHLKVITKENSGHRSNTSFWI